MSGFCRVRRAMGLAGWIFVYAAVIVIAWEIFVSIKSARYVMISAGEQWYQLHAPSLAAFQDFLAVQIPSVVANPLSDLLLSWPAGGVYGGAGLVLRGIARVGGESPADRGKPGKVALRDLAWHGPIVR
ncbi:MAG: hypothetical protein ACTSX7_12670 [Alphaproteobacteria bacterium]